MTEFNDLEPKTIRCAQSKVDFYKWIQETTNMAHSFADKHEARKAMGSLLYNHSYMFSECCDCYICTIITAAYDCESHNWHICDKQFECRLCYQLVSETMDILLLPEVWPSWPEVSGPAGPR